MSCPPDDDPSVRCRWRDSIDEHNLELSPRKTTGRVRPWAVETVADYQAKATITAAILVMTAVTPTAMATRTLRAVCACTIVSA
jgi:hypothetical protein